MDIIKRLERWFSHQCTGEWEHRYGIHLTTCDNPGWWLKVDLRGTALEGKPHRPRRQGDFEHNTPTPPWLDYHVENGVYHGAGDKDRLEEILAAFLDWAEE